MIFCFQKIIEIIVWLQFFIEQYFVVFDSCKNFIDKVFLAIYDFVTRHLIRAQNSLSFVAYSIATGFCGRLCAHLLDIG